MISVCMATYNGSRYIHEQLASILPQLSPDDEVIVSDDGSTDSTLERIAALNNPLIRVIHNTGRHSPIYNFENALRHAQGDYIFLCDQDDVWADNKVQVMMQALQHSCCIVSDCAVTDASLQVVSPSFYEVVRKHEGKWYNLLIRNCYLGCCMAFRRELLNQALPFPDNIPMHDIWLGNVASFYYSISFLPQVLMKYRRHGSNVSSTSSPSVSTLWQKFRYRWSIAWNLLLRFNKR